MADIPNVPGVPPLASYAPDPVEPVLTSDRVVGYGVGLSPAWGIYYQGRPIITANSVVAFDFRDESAIANYPVERGGFESYNKVKVPFLAKVQFTTGGTEQDRSDLLVSVAAAKEMIVNGKPAQFDVVTPEIVYSKVSISHYDYKRGAQSGLGLIIVDVWVQEVREQNTGVGGPADSASPSGGGQSNSGNVQGTEVTGVTADEAQRGVL